MEDLTKSKATRRAEKVATAGISTRTAVMGLFGMMNWLYTWYKPRVDPSADVIARQISDIFLQGLQGQTNSSAAASGS